MNRKTKNLLQFFILIIAISCLTESAMSQLLVEWHLETPANENHKFREIGVSKSGKYLYIADLYTDLVYIYKNNQSGDLINSFGDPSWRKELLGPYGVDVAEDGQIYIAVWDNEDNNMDGKPDHSLWSSTPNGMHLIRVCYLPGAPRGIKIIGGGAKTIVYVSGNDGNVIRCVRINANKFNAETLFETGIEKNQQDVVSTYSESILYISSWTPGFWWSFTPYESAITRWNNQGIRDESFSVAYLPHGVVPGVILDESEENLYLFHIGIPRGDAHIYKVNPVTGEEIGFVTIDDGGKPGGGGINLSRNKDIYFSRTYAQSDDGYWISNWGKVIDLQSTRKEIGQELKN
jgi:hypothetical protein